MAASDRSFRVIAESSRHIVGHIFETTIVVEKSTGRESSLGSHYGDPKVALIGPEDRWFIAGGQGLTYLSAGSSLLVFLRDQRKDEDNDVYVSYVDATGRKHAFEGVAPQEFEQIFVERLEILPSGEVAVYAADDGSRPSWFFHPTALTVRRAS